MFDPDKYDSPFVDRRASPLVNKLIDLMFTDPARFRLWSGPGIIMGVEDKRTGLYGYLEDGVATIRVTHPCLPGVNVPVGKLNLPFPTNGVEQDVLCVAAAFLHRVKTTSAKQKQALRWARVYGVEA